MAGKSPLAANDDHLLALHAAIEIEALWKALRSLLRERIPCERVTLFLGHIGMHEARTVYTDPPMPDLDRDYYARRAAASPFSRFIEENIGIDSYRFSDALDDPAGFPGSPFEQEFAQREGWLYGLSGLVWLGQELRGMFSLYRGAGQSDFSDSEVELLRELLPLIAIAFDRVRRLHRERLYRAVLEDFNRNMPVGLLLLDWDLVPIYTNTEATRLVAEWNFGPEANKQFNPREVFKMPAALLDCCGQLKQTILDEGDPAVRRLNKNPLRVDACPAGLTAAVRPIRLNSVNIANPGFFVSVESDEERQAPGAPATNDEKMLLLNQLTPSERELALLVGEGLSNREIAERLNKSVLTVKKQLNSAFGKLNIASRARLIALLH